MQNLKCKMQNFKPTQLIAIAFFSLVFLFSSFVPLFSADLAVESGGKLKTETATFIEQASDPAQKADGTGGRVVYENDHVYVSDGSTWNAVAGGKTVATRIVGVSRSPADPALDSRLTNKTADYICDGTDDQVQINAAIDSLVDSSGKKIPGVIYLLEGTYSISSSINFDNTGSAGSIDSGKSLIGTGAGTILKKAVGSSEFSVISAANIANVLISQLQIDGSQTAGGGVDFNTVTYSKVDKIWIKGLNESAGMKAGVWLEGSSYNVISNVTIKEFNFTPGTTANGIELASNSDNNIVCQNYISQCSKVSLFVGSASEKNVVCDNIIVDAIGAEDGYGAIWVRGDNNVVRNNIVSGCAHHGIGIDGDYCTVSGNSVTNNDKVGIILSSTGGTLEGTTPVPAYVVIKDNVISDNDLGGIKINKSEGGNTISGNMLYDNGASGAYDGIFVVSDSSYNLISGNYIYDSLPADTTGGYGINIGTSANNYLAANYINGAGYFGTGYDRRIKDLGTNTKYTGKDKITVEPVSYTVADGGRIDIISSGTGPVTYLRLAVAGSANIELAVPDSINDGKAIGDMLILENTSNYSIRLRDESTGSNSNFEISGSDDNRTLSKNTTAKFIWNGTAWLELVHADN